MRIVQALGLTAALCLGGGCASLPLPSSAAMERPFPPGADLETQAYALLQAYAASLEVAQELVARPETPRPLTAALSRAEALATPAVETLALALAEYLRAQAELQRAPGEGAARNAAVAGAALAQAVAKAEAPMRAFLRAVS